MHLIEKKNNKVNSNIHNNSNIKNNNNKNHNSNEVSIPEMSHKTQSSNLKLKKKTDVIKENDKQLITSNRLMSNNSTEISNSQFQNYTSAVSDTNYAIKNIHHFDKRIDKNKNENIKETTEQSNDKLDSNLRDSSESNNYLLILEKDLKLYDVTYFKTKDYFNNNMIPRKLPYFGYYSYENNNKINKNEYDYRNKNMLNMNLQNNRIAHNSPTIKSLNFLGSNRFINNYNFKQKLNKENILNENADEVYKF